MTEARNNDCKKSFLFQKCIKIIANSVLIIFFCRGVVRNTFFSIVRVISTQQWWFFNF
jgi:hypothetical protein